MASFILDTDHLSLFQRGHPAVIAKVLATPLSQRAITIITAEEQLRGRLGQIKKAQTTEIRIKAYRELKKLLHFFANISILNFDQAASNHFEGYKKTKIRIGSQDLRIAAIAQATNSILVTRNYKDFKKIPNIMLENWATSDLA